jgi:hypothetical protein
MTVVEGLLSVSVTFLVVSIACMIYEIHFKGAGKRGKKDIPCALCGSYKRKVL